MTLHRTHRLAALTLLVALASAGSASAQLVETLDMDGYSVKLVDGAMLPTPTKTPALGDAPIPLASDSFVLVKGQPVDANPELMSPGGQHGLQAIVFTGESALQGLVWAVGREQFDLPGYRWYDRSRATDAARLASLGCVLGGSDEATEELATKTCANLFAAPVAHIQVHTVRAEQGFLVQVSGLAGGLPTLETLSVSDSALAKDPDAFVDAVLDAVARADWTN